MKLNKFYLALLVLLVFLPQTASSKQEKWFKNAVKQSEKQLLLAAEAYKDSGKNPRSAESNCVQLVTERDWTSGFFPGSLWYLYELTGNEAIKEKAALFTSFVEKAKYRTNTHDLGFILYCSYGNGYRITGNENYAKVLETGAETLIKRYNSKVGLIKSWDAAIGPWQYPVIIDNMMNLELLCSTGQRINNILLMNIAISHADKTLENHFRSDFSCYHVVEYDTVSGKVIKKQTHQGYADSSSWARGQAWALYGFTMMYRFTKKEIYLHQAENIANFLLNHKRLPKDKIPYWDFDAPGIPNEPRDASAAAVMASALIELAGYVSEKNEYLAVAKQQLMTLSSKKYLAATSENNLFVLKHSTGNYPKKSEIDAPLSYADYYYLEALLRYKKINK